MITSMGLEKLGFTLKDFILQDDGDGIYIKEWFSDKPRPTTADIEIAHTEWQIEYEAEQVAAAETKSSAIGKLNALGLNDAEIASITGG